MVVNSAALELCMKSCCWSGCCMLQEPESWLWSHPSKGNLTSCLPSSFSLLIPTTGNLLLLVCQENTTRQDSTTALWNHWASFFPRLHLVMKSIWHHTTRSCTHNLTLQIAATTGYVFICYPSIFNIEDIILLSDAKLTRLGYFSFLNFIHRAKCHRWWEHSSW